MYKTDSSTVFLERAYLTPVAVKINVGRENVSIASLLILFCFVLFSIFCILVDDYTIYFIGSPCYNVSCYNYISL